MTSSPSGVKNGHPGKRFASRKTSTRLENVLVALSKSMTAMECPWLASWSLKTTFYPSAEKLGILAPVTIPVAAMAAPDRVLNSLDWRGPSMPGLLRGAKGKGAKKPPASAGCAAVSTFVPSGYTALKPQSSSPMELVASDGGSVFGLAATSNELLE